MRPAGGETVGKNRILFTETVLAVVFILKEFPEGLSNGEVLYRGSYFSVFPEAHKNLVGRLSSRLQLRRIRATRRSEDVVPKRGTHSKARMVVLVMMS